MAVLGSQLALDRCPHCSIAKPLLHNAQGFLQTEDYTRKHKRIWKTYQCATCGGVVVAGAAGEGGEVTECYPTVATIDEAIPERARSYLQQASETLHAPSGSVMLSASAVDAMLKAKNYKSGTLYSRIEQAAKDHIITPEMAEWAHQVRLDANDQRHSDETGPEPDSADARRSLEFAKALAQFLFILPAMVQKGIKESTSH